MTHKALSSIILQNTETQIQYRANVITRLHIGEGNFNKRWNIVIFALCNSWWLQVDTREYQIAAVRIENMYIIKQYRPIFAWCYSCIDCKCIDK